MAALGLPGGSAGKESAWISGDPSLIPALGRSAREGIGHRLQYSWASLVAQLVKDLPAMQDTWVGKIPWRTAWQPLQYYCLENPHRQRSLAGYSPPGHRVRHDWLSTAQHMAALGNFFLVMRVGVTSALVTSLVVQSLSHVQLFVTPWTAAHQTSLSFTVSWSLLKLMSIASVMPSNHLVLCHPLLFLSSIFPSIRVFSNGSALRIR